MLTKCRKVLWYREMPHNVQCRDVGIIRIIDGRFEERRLVSEALKENRVYRLVRVRYSGRDFWNGERQKVIMQTQSE